jgi:hypothetical protein
MTAVHRLRSPPVDVRRQAEALVEQGRLREAAALVDGFLARHDGGWHLWRLCGELAQRLGRTRAAIASYRACARQLEAAGHLSAASRVLMRALRLDPLDDDLRADVKRLAPPRPALPLETPPLPRRPAAPRRAHLESVTDPYIALFDILDDEARAVRAAASTPATSAPPTSAQRTPRPPCAVAARPGRPARHR